VAAARERAAGQGKAPAASSHTTIQGPFTLNSDTPYQQNTSRAPGGKSNTSQAVPIARLPSSMGQHLPQDTELHVFFVFMASSLLGSSHRLRQTPVGRKTNQTFSAMADHEFFAWLRDQYLSHRGLLPSWLGLLKYSHCEFYQVSISWHSSKHFLAL
jgi:hypothetical protein